MKTGTSAMQTASEPALRPPARPVPRHRRSAAGFTLLELVAVIGIIAVMATIVVGGELAGMGDLLLDTVRRVLAERCPAGAIRKLKLELSALEPEDTARGAAIMIRDRVFGIGDRAD